MFQSIGGLSEEAASNNLVTQAEAAKLVGVAPDKVIKDLAENAEKLQLCSFKVQLVIYQKQQ